LTGKTKRNRRVSQVNFLVGDAAQMIYSFRGAKSKNIAEISNAIYAKLTSSFLYGKEIAAVAKTVLFVIKGNCTRKNIWVSYKLQDVKESLMFFMIIMVGSGLSTYLRTTLAFTNLEYFNAALPMPIANHILKIALIREGYNSGLT